MARFGKGAPLHALPRPLKRAAKQLAERLVPRDWLIVRGSLAAPEVSLTFDDGPHPEHTPRVLDALGEHGIKATFFLIGFCIERAPRLVERIVREGHEIGNHTYSHARPQEISPEVLIEEIGRTAAAIRSAGARPNRFFRPPFGELTMSKLWALRRHGHAVVMWNTEFRENELEEVAPLRRRIESWQAQPGDLVLMHDNNPKTGLVVQDLAKAARENGTRFVPLSRWIAPAA